MALNRTVETWSIKGADLLGLVPDQCQADPEYDGEEQDLQHVVARQRIDRRGRNDVEDEACDAAALELRRVVRIGAHGLGVERRRVDVHAVAGREYKRENKADHERNRCHDLEIDQRLDPDPPNLLEVAGAGNAVHHDTEHDRGDDHGDQFEKAVAQNLEAGREIGPQHADHDAEQQRHQDLDEQ
jgi:hypothetical protein